jgi:hypothetical protein
MRRGSWCTSFYERTATADNPAANKNAESPEWRLGGLGCFYSGNQWLCGPGVRPGVLDVGEGYVGVHLASRRGSGEAFFAMPRMRPTLIGDIVART